KEWAKWFYNSKAWKTCRVAYIKTVFGICENRCGKPGYIVDHITELTPQNIHDPAIALGHDNLQYLCLECHNTKTFQKNSNTALGVMFDEEGNLIEGQAISKRKKYW